MRFSTERRQRILQSVPVMFLMYTITFGVLTHLIGLEKSHQPVLFTVVAAVIFGTLMTYLVQMRLRELDETSGLSDKKQQMVLRDAVNSGTLPSDPEVLRAMPAYLTECTNRVQLSQKRGSPMLVLVGIVTFILAVVNGVIFQMVLAVVLISLGFLNYFMATKQLSKYAHLRKLL